MFDHAATVHLLALLITLGVECTGMALWARFTYPNWRRAILAAFTVNLVVHTLFWYSQPLFVSNWPWGLYGAEAIVVLVEGATYARLLTLGGITPWQLSTLLNLASLLVGLWLWQWML